MLLKQKAILRKSLVFLLGLGLTAGAGATMPRVGQRDDGSGYGSNHRPGGYQFRQQSRLEWAAGHWGCVFAERSLTAARTKPRPTW